MASLPTVGSDRDAWGTELNDFLLVAHNADGTEKGGGGSGLSSVWEYSLKAASSAGATTITLDRTAAPLLSSRDLIAIIDPWTVNCEVRQAATVSGSTITLQSALSFAHAKDVNVIFTADDSVGVALWGAIGANNNANDDWAAIQAGINQAQLNLLWLTGGGIKHVVRQPMLGCDSGRMRGFVIKAHPTLFAPADTLGAMFMTVQNPWTTFTASAATDTFTTLINSGAVVGNKIAFNAPNGQTLPGGIVGGRVYFVKTTPSTTTFTIAATSGGATIDITSDGAGISYTNVNSLERFLFDDVYLAGNSVAGLNGLMAYLQQPEKNDKFRADGFPGTAVILGGQISNWYHAEINPALNGTGLSVVGSGHNFFGINMDGVSSGDTGIVIGTNVLGVAAGASRINFYGLWTENIDTHIAFKGPGLGIGFHGVYPHQSAGDVYLQIDAAVGAAQRTYVFTNMGRADGTGYTILNDDTLSLTVLSTRLPQLMTSLWKQDSGAGIRPILYELAATGSLDFPNILANTTTAALTVTVTGATVGDRVAVSTSDALESGLVIAQAWVSAANTVSITLANVTVGAINPAAHTFTVNVLGVG